MRKKFILLLLFIPFLAINCHKPNCTLVCGMKEFRFFNDEGNDIFNENIPGHLTVDQIRAYTPEGRNLNVIHGVYQGVNYFHIEINGNPDRAGITYLELGSLTTDTIYARWKKKENSRFISELYYNNTLLETNNDIIDCENSDPINIIVKPD